MGSGMPLKTLARMLSYIGRHSPGEFGLYWNPDGTMPWKEFYWALQEDEALRFVRESHVRELALQGLELPFSLENNRLRLIGPVSAPEYPVSEFLPGRLFYACRRAHLEVIRLRGLQASGRPYVLLCAEREQAVRIAKRREAEPIVIEIKAEEARAAGTLFRKAGATVYLVERVAADHLVFPLLRALPERTAPKGRRGEHGTRSPAVPAAPGSFLVRPGDIGATAEGGKKTKGRRGADWKRQARKDRHKRSV
ncbi:MAG TPA: hypothetical protein PK250_05980 [Syntrophobacter fumaroxidans]|mgnify:CR=1 FL=1|nr:hypothetical protein [Syntrophobacter fumaroxidans]